MGQRVGITLREDGDTALTRGLPKFAHVTERRVEKRYAAETRADISLLIPRPVNCFEGEKPTERYCYILVRPHVGQRDAGRGRCRLSERWCCGRKQCRCAEQEAFQFHPI